MKTERDEKRKMSIRSQLAVLGQPWAGLICFIKQRPILAGGMAAVLALVYGTQAFSNYYYIDKEVLVNDPGTFYNWGEIGRFGLILVKKVLGMSWYNPYLAGVLLLITLWMTAMAAGYLFHSVEKRLTTLSLGIFMLLFLVYPTYVEQFLFQFQAFEVVLAMLFLLVSDWYLVQALREKNRMAFLASIPLVVIAFGIYQSMVPLQLCLYLAIFLMLTYVEEGRKEIIFTAIRYSVFHFVAVFGIYELVSRLFFSGSGYLGDQIIWRTGHYRAAVLFILRYMGIVIKMEEIGYTLTYDLCIAIGAAAMFVLFLRYRWKSGWYGLGLLGVVLSPFFLTFVIGNSQMYRVQLTLPMTCGVLWLFGIHIISRELRENWKKAARVLLTVMGCIMIFLNLSPVMRLLYSRDVVGKADEMTAVMIIGELGRYQSVYQGKPVIFIGHRAPMTNNASFEPRYTEYGCDTYSIFSVFEMDYMFEPCYFFSTHRILGFFTTLGYDFFQEPDAAMMPYAYEDSADMPVWPLEGSVKEFEDYIIVKLSPYEY